MRFREFINIFLATLNQLKYPIITIASVLGFAYIANNSGMSITMAKAFANTGFLFPFFAPVLGWLGVFLTGSDTSSNALFGKLQYATANSIGIDPVVTVAANATGGVTGKMISPQSIAVGVAAVGLVGKESDLFRFTFKHSFIFLFLICILTLSQAYVIKWIIPVYQMLDSKIGSIKPNLLTGYAFIAILAGTLIAIVATVMLLNKKRK
jgi:lactate permease